MQDQRQRGVLLVLGALESDARGEKYVLGQAGEAYKLWEIRGTPRNLYTNGSDKVHHDERRRQRHQGQVAEKDKHGSPSGDQE